METIKTITDPNHPEYRARIVLDEMPHQPEDDGACPIVWLEYRHGWQAETIDQTFSKDVYSRSRAVEDAAVHFLGGGYDGLQRRGHVALERFERYLRIFHGVTSIDVYESDSQYYIAYDPAETREKWGLDAETWLAENPGKKIANLGEYRSYLEGDCYGVVVEKAEVWARVGTDETRTEWAEVDSCWGYYGDVDGYPTEAAEELLKDAWSD